MKTTKILLAIIALAFTFTACDNKPPVLPKGFEYTTTEDKYDKGLGRQIVRVNINQGLNNTELHELSDWIRNGRPDANEVIIFYNRTDVEFVGAWARVDYKPEYELDMIAIPKIAE